MSAESDGPRVPSPVLRSLPRQVSAEAGARALAASNGVRLEGIVGSGPQGRVTVGDVQATIRQETAARALTASSQPTAQWWAPAAGDPLPAFTASGIDPKDLVGVQPSLRAAVAAAPTRAEAFSLAQRYAGLTDDQVRERLAVDDTVDARYGGYRGSWGTDAEVSD